MPVLKGFHHSEETKTKMKLARCGRKPNLGIKFSQEWRDNIGRAQRGDKNYFYGKHYNNSMNPAWKGGVTKDPLYQKAGHPEYWKVKLNAKKRRDAFRLKCIDYYSHGENSCACCGENLLEFLSIDHINGGGGKERKNIRRSGVGIATWLVKNNFPPGYRILCHNCNASLGYYGYCPHGNVPLQRGRPEITQLLGVK